MSDKLTDAPHPNSKKTEERVQNICQLRSNGYPEKYCCYLVGIDETTLKRWIEEDVDFAVKWRSSTARGGLSYVDVLKREEPWKCAKTFDHSVFRDETKVTIEEETVEIETDSGVTEV